MRETGDVPELGRRRARKDCLDTKALVGQLVLERVAQSEDVGFRRAVDAVQRLWRDTHDGGDIYECASPSCDEGGRRRVAQTRQGGDVQRDHGVHLVDVGLEERSDRPDTGVVDQHVDAGVIPQPGLDAGEVGLVVEVGNERLDRNACLGLEPCGDVRQPLLVSRHENQVVPAALRDDRRKPRRCRWRRQ